MSNYASKVLKIAKAEVGYLEKASNKSLDSKTGNAGKGNYTKYARDLDAISGFYNGKKNGFAWCDVFVDWVFVKAFGASIAKTLLCQPSKSLGAGCGYSANYYKQKGQFHVNNPQPGDQIFFCNSTRKSVIHTGLVVKADSKYVYTIEGNTSGASGVISNGGGVCEKKYALTNNCIYGYGRPKYDPEVKTETTTYSLKSFIKDVQKACGATVDGIAGPNTINKTVTLSAHKNTHHSVVKPVQKRLYALGYTQVGAADGVTGSKFTSAVKAYQKDNGCVVDGEITAKSKTWRKLLGML